jgi:hypothetical protein
MDTGIKVRAHSISNVFLKTVRNRKFSGYTAALDRMIPALFSSYYRYDSFAEHIDANGFFDPVAYTAIMPDQCNIEYSNNTFEQYMNISEIYKELANKVF